MCIHVCVNMYVRMYLGMRLHLSRYTVYEQMQLHVQYINNCVP